MNTSAPIQRKKASTSPTTISNPSDKDRKVSKKSTSISIVKKILQGIVIFIVVFFLSSYAITDTWTWGYRNKYTNWRHWIPVYILLFNLFSLSMLLFTIIFFLTICVWQKCSVRRWYSPRKNLPNMTDPIKIYLST